MRSSEKERNAGILENIIQEMVSRELAKHQSNELIPISEFCRQAKVSRITLWRQEKQGMIKLTRIGRKVFVNPQQFRAQQ